MSAVKKFLDEQAEKADAEDWEGLLTFSVTKEGRIVTNAVDVPDWAIPELIAAIERAIKRLEEANRH